MKLSTRLALAFVTLFLLPVVLIVLTGNAILSYQTKVLSEEYGVKFTKTMFFTSPVQLMNRSTLQMQERLQKEILKDPEKFRDPVFLSEVSAKLRAKSAYMVVRSDDVVIFASPGIERIAKYLPDYSGKSPEVCDFGMYTAPGDQDPVYIKQQDFIFPKDHSRGSVFVIAKPNEWRPEIRSLVIRMGLASLFILVITALAFTYLIYRSIMKPLDRLREGTHMIREGNLDFKIQGNEKDPIGALCSDFDDMRQRLKDSAEEKVQTDAGNRELISNISHDLKTPITAIKGYVEGIIDGVANTPEKLNRYVRTIYNKANDMDRLIDELTFYSKIDTNRIPYNFAKIPLNEFFGDCAEEIGLDMEARNIDFSYSNYCDESTLVIADAEQLRRVINNIIGNSVKYLDKPHGKISIRVKDVGDFVQIEIEDNGQGISKADIPYIFDRFFRTDLSRNSSKGGSGIGLSIVRKIIEDHGGRVWASSKEGTGTVMYFVLRKYREVTNE